MTITLDLPSEVESQFSLQAAARGVSLQTYLIQLAQDQSEKAELPLSIENFVRELDSLIASLPDSPTLPDEAFHRASWYSERG